MSVTKVVILNWNGEAHLSTFLPTVIATTPADVAVVVADNGSTDGSVAMLAREFPQVEVIEFDRNYGFAEGYNRALALIEADYYILLNSDVETTKGWCEPLIEAMESDKTLAAAAPKLRSLIAKDKFEYAGASGGFIDILGYPFCRGRILSTIEEDNGQYDSVCDVFWTSGACFIFRGELFHRIGGFDARFFAHMEEIDLCWRAQLLGYRVAVYPQSVVYHLGGGTLPNNTPRKLFLNFRNNLAMLYKNLPKGEKRVTLLARMALDAGSALVYLLQGRTSFFMSVWDAHMEFYRWRADLRKSRKQIQSSATTRVTTIYRGSILLQYILGKRYYSQIFRR